MTAGDVQQVLVRDVRRIEAEQDRRLAAHEVLSTNFTVGSNGLTRKVAGKLTVRHAVVKGAFMDLVIMSEGRQVLRTYRSRDAAKRGDLAYHQPIVLKDVTAVAANL